jgi:hypothetical protein
MREGEIETKVNTKIHGFVKGLGSETIWIDRGLDDEAAATTLVHEFTHTQQVEGMDSLEAEVEAHVQQAQFMLDKNMGMPPEWIKNGLVDKEEIREYLKNHPGYSPPPGNYRIGLEPMGEEKETGWDCSRIGL